MSDFDTFWAAYPRKQAKRDAFKAWGQVHPPLEAVLTALAWQCDTDQWTRDDGAYIPLPASYLRGWRWEDEPMAIAPKSQVDRRPAWLKAVK